MIRRMLHLWTILLTLFTFPAMTAMPVRAAERPAPVWMFNPKEVFLDVACLDNEHAVVVGDRGRVLVTHRKFNNLWTPRDSGTKEMLTSVSFVDETHGWAAGHGGVIIHTDDGGDTWRVQRESSPENLPLLDIQFVSRSVGYASGAYDTVLKTADGGGTWRSVSTGGDSIYNGVYFLDANTGFLLGEFGSLLKTTDGGESWLQVDTGDYQGSLFGMTFISASRAIAFGINGKLMLSDDAGVTWRDVPTGTKAALYRAAVSGDDIVIVGKSGVILASTDGATTFLDRSGDDSYTLAGACANAGNGFIAVGEFGKILRIEGLRDE